MSIIAQTANGWILDHRNFSTLVVDSEKSECGQQYALKQSLFEINVPFMMDSQFEKLQRCKGETTENTRIRKKRKRKQPMNFGEILADEYHDEVKGYITKALTELSDIGKKKGYFIEQSPTDVYDNNIAARQSAVLACDEPDFIQECEQKPFCTWRLNIDKGTDMSDQRMVNVIMKYNGSRSVLVKYHGRQYFIPSNSSFLMSDIHYLNMFAEDLGRYDLIVMDPPWQNKAVKRQKKYYTLDNDMLLDIPLIGLAGSQCLVVVWVTNKQKHIDFVTGELFPSNGIEYLTTWYWLKVTKSAECVYDLDSPHKKPYETLIIGLWRQSTFDRIDDTDYVSDIPHSYLIGDDYSNHGNDDTDYVSNIPPSYLIKDVYGYQGTDKVSDESDSSLIDNDNSNHSYNDIDKVKDKTDFNRTEDDNSNHDNDNIDKVRDKTDSSQREDDNSCHGYNETDEDAYETAPSQLECGNRNHGYNDADEVKDKKDFSQREYDNSNHGNDDTDEVKNKKDFSQREYDNSNHGNDDTDEVKNKKDSSQTEDYYDYQGYNDTDEVKDKKDFSQREYDNSNHGYNDADELKDKKDFSQREYDNSNHGNDDTDEVKNKRDSSQTEDYYDYQGYNDTDEDGDESDSSQLEGGKRCLGYSIPVNQVLVSIPCSLHSKKPPLLEVLKPYLPNNPRCLELFARNLLPNWTSWGNEVLFHQDKEFYEEVT